jgi:hypothetical protein
MAIYPERNSQKHNQRIDSGTIFSPGQNQFSQNQIVAAIYRLDTEQLQESGYHRPRDIGHYLGDARKMQHYKNDTK